MDAKKTNKETPQERANFLQRTARYLANDAICELHESHFTYWDKVRDKTIPCIIVVLGHLGNQFYYWTPQNDAKIAEVKSIIATLENLIISKPSTKDQITRPLDLVVNFIFS